MSTAKQLIMESLSGISDDIQDEFEVMENLYKLLRYRKSKQLIVANGGHSTEDVRAMFQQKHEEREMLV